MRECGPKVRWEHRQGRAGIGPQDLHLDIVRRPRRAIMHLDIQPVGVRMRGVVAYRILMRRLIEFYSVWWRRVVRIRIHLDIHALPPIDEAPNCRRVGYTRESRGFSGVELVVADIDVFLIARWAKRCFPQAVTERPGPRPVARAI